MNADLLNEIEMLRANEERLRDTMILLGRQRDEAIRERDLAIAHDRQPYPTAWAYERACEALHEHEARAERYRLAWTSARQRAAAYLEAVVAADEERDALRAELRRLGEQLEEVRAQAIEAIEVQP